MIVYFDEFDKVKNKDYAFMYNLLPASRKQKIDQKTLKNDKKIAIIEYFLVKKVLKLKNCPDFEYTKFGKPYIQNKHFSISHSKNMLVVCSYKNSIGVDVENKIEYNDKLAKYICSENEYKKICDSKDKSLSLTKLWTQKESFIKCKGQTIFCDLKNVLADTNGYKFCFHNIKNFVVCECKKV